MQTGCFQQVHFLSCQAGEARVSGFGGAEQATRAQEEWGLGGGAATSFVLQFPNIHKHTGDKERLLLG